MHSLKQRADNLKLKVQAASKIQNSFRKFLVAKRSKSESVRELAEAAMEARGEDKSHSHTRNLETLIQQKLESRDRSNRAASPSESQELGNSGSKGEIENLLERRTPQEIEYLMEVKTPTPKQAKEKEKDEKTEEEMQMPQLSLIPKIRSSPKKLPSKKIPLDEEIKADIQESGEPS